MLPNFGVFKTMLVTPFGNCSRGDCPFHSRSSLLLSDFVNSKSVSKPTCEKSLDHRQLLAPEMNRDPLHCCCLDFPVRQKPNRQLFFPKHLYYTPNVNNNQYSRILQVPRDYLVGAFFGDTFSSENSSKIFITAAVGTANSTPKIPYI